MFCSLNLGVGVGVAVVICTESKLLRQQTECGWFLKVWRKTLSVVIPWCLLKKWAVWSRKSLFPHNAKQKTSFSRYDIFSTGITAPLFREILRQNRDKLTIPGCWTKYPCSEDSTVNHVGVERRGADIHLLRLLFSMPFNFDIYFYYYKVTFHYKRWLSKNKWLNSLK